MQNLGILMAKAAPKRPNFFMAMSFPIGIACLVIGAILLVWGIYSGMHDKDVLGIDASWVCKISVAVLLIGVIFTIIGVIRLG